MRVWRNGCLYLAGFSSVILAGLTSGLVFAEDSIIVSIIPDSVTMNMLPGEFDEESQIITASTTNAAGYTIGIRTTGPSSALTNTEDDSYTIPTFVLPSESESIPVGELGDGYGYSVDGGANYLPIPEPSLHATTLFKTMSAGGNTHELTFGVKVPIDAVAGTYTNTFVIEAVANLEPCAANSVCYYGNNDDGTGLMEDQSNVPSNSSVTLIPSNFSRPGYGFAGWNTEIDGTSTTYGPSQTITVGNLDNEGLQLYARWIPSAGNLQGWEGCESMNRGEVTALTDIRDGNTYAIAKYNDDKCWMMENLRLDFSNLDVAINSQNTNKPTSSFVTAINVNPALAPTNDFCTATNQNCVNSILYNTNNINRNLTPAYNIDSASSSWYSYGVYYNYYTATAGNGDYSLTKRGAIVNGDICPAGWRLPTAYISTDDMGTLDSAYGGNGNNQETGSTALAGSERWRTYPLNYMFSGEQKGASSYNRGVSTGMNSANNNNASGAFNFWLRAAAVNMTGNSTSKNRGQTIRCVAKNTRDIVGDIHYDSNGGFGTMADETDVNFATATAANNQFTRTNFRFVGWNTNANGNGTTVPAGSVVENAAIQLGLEDGDTLILYAIWQPVYRVVYDGNGADAGSMASVTHEDVTSNFYVVASNYSKVGYGFAGWSADANAGTKLLNHETVTVYGPNENIKFNNTFLDNADENNKITLYAVWLTPDTTDTLQSFNNIRCNTMNTGDYLALRDERDGNVYAVSKLVDGHCWMTENLRLNPSTTTFTTANTNGPTTAFISKAASSQDATTLCNDDEDFCIDRVLFNGNNMNSSMTASPTTNNNSSSWYSYGMMYGWYTATAGNGDFEMASGSVIGDICPAGWRLPTGGTGGEFESLVNAVGGANASAKLDNMLAFPNNFIYSGDYNYNTSGGRGTYGRYWSATANTKIKAHRLGLAPSNNGLTPTGAWNKWDAFAVRCVVK